MVLHSPFGRGVNAAWALAVGQRVAELTGDLTIKGKTKKVTQEFG